MVYIVILTLLTGVVAHGLIVFAQRKVPIGIMSMMQVGQPALAVVFGFATVVVQTQPRTARMIATENGELAGSAG